ncbi:MAG: hypothetical protein KGZ71_01030 [Desulfobulbaceae bacterium]|nr:hypothetical protein [Desulfobulbaceae bacterium]
MKKKIYISNNDICDIITANAKSASEHFDFELKLVDEKNMLKAITSNHADLALVSPLVYGMCMNKADLRIIPEKCLAFVGFNGKSSILFRQGEKNLSKVGALHINDYLSVIAKILFSERYDIEPQFVEYSGSSTEIPQELSAILRIGDFPDKSSLDLSEDWFDSFEFPLPIAFWVGRNEEIIPEFIDFIKSSAADELPTEYPVHEHIDENTGQYVRSGSVITKWNDEVRSALDQTLQMLYLRTYFTDIPAVKLVGDENFLV